MAAPSMASERLGLGESEVEARARSRARSPRQSGSEDWRLRHTDRINDSRQVARGRYDNIVSYAARASAAARRSHRPPHPSTDPVPRPCLSAARTQRRKTGKIPRSPITRNPKPSHSWRDKLQLIKWHRESKFGHTYAVLYI